MNHANKHVMVEVYTRKRSLSESGSPFLVGVRSGWSLLTRTKN